MRIVKGDRVEHMGNQGVVIGTCYIISMGTRYIDVYFGELKKTRTLAERDLRKIK